MRFDLICENFGQHFINKAYVCIRRSFICFPRHLVSAATDKLLETLLLVYWMTVRLLLDYSRLLLDETVTSLLDSGRLLLDLVAYW